MKTKQLPNYSVFNKRSIYNSDFIHLEKYQQSKLFYIFPLQINSAKEILFGVCAVLHVFLFFFWFLNMFFAKESYFNYVCGRLELSLKNKPIEVNSNRNFKNGVKHLTSTSSVWY
mgnify:CR=1 FL=1